MSAPRRTRRTTKASATVPARLPIGKLPAARLEALLHSLPQSDPRVLIGPRLGEDAAVIDMGERYLVVAADPVTFAADRIGWYAVHINANDVAVLGATPRWFLAVLLLPERETTTDLVTHIMDDIRDTCASMDVTVCGGHTEITTGLDRPIVIGQMLGEVAPARLIRKDGLRPGDLILVTHGAAIEGTAILAREQKGLLTGRVPSDVVDRAARLIFEPGISIVEAARTAAGAGDVHAMHDPTEGGLETALAELAYAAGTGMEVFVDRIPVLPETRAVADALGIDPLRLIASGALLVGVAARDADAVVGALGVKGIPAVMIAEARSKDFGLVCTGPRGQWPLEAAGRDEMARVLGSCRE